MSTVIAATQMLVIIMFLGAPGAMAQETARQPPQNVTSTAENVTKKPSQQAIKVRFLKAVIIDDRLSALRRQPNLQSIVIRRIRLAQTVYVIDPNPADARENYKAAERKDRETSLAGPPKFVRIAVTRRTRGWIHKSAIAVQSRAGEEQRIMTLIDASNDPVDRITLCRIIIERFGRSRLVPRAFLLLAQEADRVAATLSQRTRRRLADLHESEASLRSNGASMRDYYLSDAGLDRYSRLGIAFEFNDSTGEFAYDGNAFREIVRRFPDGEEARLARQHLEHVSRNRSQTP